MLGIEVPAEERDEDFFGPGTEAAIRQFQNANGLPVLGVVDDATARGLGLGGYPKSITGMVCQPDGTPVPDVAIHLHQHGPGGDRVVAETRSGPEGTYSLPWPHGVSGGLTVRADGGGEKSLSWKSVQASGTAWVRLSVGGEYRGAPRFAVLSSALAPVLDDKAVHAIGGDGRAHAIKAISEAVAVPHHEVSRHVLAHKLAARTRLDPSVLFALLARRVSPDPTVGDPQALDDAHVDHVFDAIMRLPLDDARSALKDAVRDNVVASFDIDAAAGELHALQIDHLAAQPLAWSITHAISDEHDCCASPAEPIRSDDADPDDPAHAAARSVQLGGAPLRDILATSVPEPAVQRQVVEALVTHDRTAKLGAVADVAKSLSPERRAHLRFTLEAAALLDNHLPLVRRVQKLHDSGAIRRSADLARLDEADWASLLREEDPGAEHIALPARSKLAAAPAGERIEHVARVLARRLERSHPTVALTGRLAKDRGELPLVQAKGVQRFLESEPSLCVRHTHIDRFVHEAASAAPVDDDHAQVIADLKTLQRGYKLTSRFDHVKAMLAAGHTSAHSISSIGPERFAAQMTEAGATPDEASAMFAAAQQVHATTMTLLGNFHSAFTAATPAAVGQPDPAAAIQALASLPTVQALFGSTDYCSCAECRAIHGPAAYLVDILQFLKSRAATGGPANAGQAVLNRRPDIAQIQLSCGNTNGIVPYIDLVCETLEDAMGTVPAAAELLRVTSGTEAEVRANPAYVRDTAYAVLKRALYPVAASFDLYGAEVRAFLGQLGIRRHELMAAWQASGAPSDNDIAADRFGLNANALSIITTASPLQPWTLWNLGSDNSGSVADVTFVAASPAVSTRTTSITLNTPGGTQVGDTLLAFFWSGESNDSSLNTGALPAGWSTVATLNTGPRQPAYLVRRTAVASEPTSHAFTSVATGSGRALVGVMLAYRGLDITAPLVASNVTNIGPGSPTTTFTCPGLGLTTYSDLYLGFVGDIAPTPTSTVPTGATKRSETQVSTNGGSHLLAFDIQKNAVVDVASQAVTLSVSTSGVAVAYALAKAHNAVPDPRKLDDLKSGDWLQILAYVPILLDRAKISHRELIQLLETRFINPTAAVKVIEAGTTINAVTNFATCDLSKQSVTGWTSDLITRFNRFIRLWRQLGCTIWDLDKMILAPAVGANLLDSNAIVQLSRVNAVAARLGGPWDELLTLWGDMDRFNYVNVLDSSEPVVPSVYRRRFRNPTVAAVSTLFVDDPSTLTGSLDDVEAFAVISAALDLSTDDIKRIRTATSMSTALNLANLSTIARHAMLADRLGLSIAELLTAIAISGVNPFANPLGTLNFLAAFDQMTASGFTIKELDYLLRHGSVIDSGIGLTDATITSWLEDLRRSLVRATSLTPAQAADLVVQRISAMLPLDQTVTQRMLQITLPGGASNIATLFTNPDLTLRNTDGSFNKLTVRANFGTIYDAYIALNKMRIVLGRWQVSTADTLWLLQNAATPSWLQLHTLPVSTSATPVTLVALNTLRQSVDIQQTLATPAGIRLFDIVLAPGATVADAAGQVAQLGGWVTADITAIATRFGMTTAASLVAGANAARIRDFMAWARKL
ncbi:MAG TPA: peptidoglycan-binding protein, partial [Kofleriaceae bacterium]|nr:peptidoglycan-binding protein [Kofleriaceae bacterium]